MKIMLVTNEPVLRQNPPRPAVTRIAPVSPVSPVSPVERAPGHLDRAGATASLLCAIHCALMPLVVTLLPLLGLAFLADERVEWAMVVLSGVLGATSLCLGFRQHRSRRALATLATGLAFLVAGRIAEHYALPWGVVIVVIGGLSVAASHILNRRLCDSCHTCSA